MTERDLEKLGGGFLAANAEALARRPRSNSKCSGLTFAHLSAVVIALETRSLNDFAPKRTAVRNPCSICR